MRSAARTKRPKRVTARPTALKTESILLSSLRLLINLLEAPLQFEADDVQSKGEDEKRRPADKDRLILQRPVRRVPKTDLNNIRRDRLDGNQRIQGKFRLLTGGNGDNHGLPDRPRNGQNDGRRNP